MRDDSPDDGSAWPAIGTHDWKDTVDTFHMWTQVIGKIQLVLQPMVNHWWQIAQHVSARGLTTSLMHAQGRGLEIEFDFIDHLLHVRSSDGQVRNVVLEPRSVASFYNATMASLAELGFRIKIFTKPTEVVEAIPFELDEEHRSYDAAAVQQFWLAMVKSHRVMREFRARFLGKSSPVHFFWGGGDLAVTRFSGRTAPLHPGGVPNCPDWVQQLAYSHEVSSCGFWPGERGEGAFYAYAYPQPDRFGDWHVEPSGAYFDKTLGEFLLPYEAVRTAADPEADLMAFCQTTYEAAAELAGWDREALEVRGA